MIERLNEPVGVVGVKVSGRLRHEDFAKVREWISDANASGGKCRVLFLFDDFRGWNAHALLDDLKFHTIHCRDIERVAYVGNRWWEGVLVNLSKPVTRSHIRYFDATALQAAKLWVENG